MLESANSARVPEMNQHPMSEAKEDSEDLVSFQAKHMSVSLVEGCSLALFLLAILGFVTNSVKRNTCLGKLAQDYV